MSQFNKIFLPLLLVIASLQFLFISSQTASANSVHILNGQIVETAEPSSDNDYKLLEYTYEGNSRLSDYANGYQIDFPADMMTDASLSQVLVSMFNDDTVIEVYYDNFNGNINTRNVVDYIAYSNRFLLNNNIDHHKLSDQYIQINGYQAHILEWERAKLSTVPNDKNHYMSAEIIKNSQEVYTIFIKSTQNTKSFLPFIKSFNIIPIQGEAKINTRFVKPVRNTLNDETLSFYQKYFSPSSPLKWGIYEFSISDNYNYLNNLESTLGGKFDFVLWYKSMSTPFPKDILTAAYNQNKYVELTLHTYLADSDNKSIMYSILNGDYDDFFVHYAQELKAFAHPVLFRLNNEMNGDWCNWSSFHYSKDAEIYKLTWKHIYNIFQNQQVNNVLWIWNPNDSSFPNFKWNHSLAYFPGDEYVDIIGLTGYNTGTYFQDEYWREFTQIYDSLYYDYNSWFDYPMMITEFACNSTGGDKSKWITDMSQNIANYPNIKVAVWFNGIDYDADHNPARIYRLDETQQTIAEFKKIFQNYSDDYVADLSLVRP
ncbi:MAG: glycoside hydrolase family 26 protein [Syntrophomonadaceae bacterium]|jgi:hypothetical protein|nr:glycoside hydrolase family 26 protein [Syntrophomonadaceae bacterium]